MTYDEALDYLASLQRFGINLGLTRIDKLLELLGRPERCFRSIHVAGSNGKGSTTAILTSVLTAAGIRTGMYISPHLDEYTERISINGRPISRDDFALAIQRVGSLAEKLAASGLEHPTEFEIITAAAFYHFAQLGVEYAVIEAGLGGRIDSTNVIDPEISIITNVTLEHVDRLGPTLRDIASHKAGIIKSTRPVVTAATGETLEVIEAEAEKLKSPLYTLGKQFTCSSIGICNYLQQIRFESDGESVVFTLRLLGPHQAQNAGVALMALKLLAKQEMRLNTKVLADGLKQANWPGRFEILGAQPTLIIDGAHNPDGARVLRQTLDQVFNQRPIVFVLGILADKDVTGIIEALVRESDRVVAVRPNSQRALAPELLAGYFPPDQVVCASTVADGMNQAAQMAGKQGVVCVAGSLYQVGEARKAALSGHFLNTSL